MSGYGKLRIVYNPNFEINSSILKYVSQIEAAKAVIENAPLLPLYERQFKNEATIRRVHYSTAIEGNYLKLNEVRQIISSPESKTLGLHQDEQGNQMVARQRDVQEVINYRDVVAYIEKIIKTDDEKFQLKKEDVFSIHKTILKNILDDKAGSYRTEPAVTVNYVTGEKLNPYEAPENIESKMDELIEWSNRAESSDIHPVIKAALLHLEFVRIHPFADGNGRLARALATLSLTVDGYDVNHFFCLDEYYDSNAADYYEFLGKGFEQPTTWIEYFALGMAIEFNRVKDRVLKISKDAKVKEKTGGQMFISERQEKIIEWLNNYSMLRNSQFDELFPDISDDTVLRELKDLIDNGVVVKVGKTKSAYYKLTD